MLRALLAALALSACASAPPTDSLYTYETEAADNVLECAIGNAPLDPRPGLDFHFTNGERVTMNGAGLATFGCDGELDHGYEVATYFGRCMTSGEWVVSGIDVLFLDVDLRLLDAEWGGQLGVTSTGCSEQTAERVRFVATELH